MSDMKPVAWVRRWYFEGRQPPPKVKNAKGRWEWPKESKFVAVTPIKLFADDVALYAQDDATTQLITRLTEALELCLMDSNHEAIRGNPIAAERVKIAQTALAAVAKESAG